MQRIYLQPPKIEPAILSVLPRKTKQNCHAENIFTTPENRTGHSLGATAKNKTELPCREYIYNPRKSNRPFSRCYREKQNRTAMQRIYLQPPKIEPAILSVLPRK